MKHYSTALPHETLLSSAQPYLTLAPDVSSNRDQYFHIYTIPAVLPHIQYTGLDKVGLYLLPYCVKMYIICAAIQDGQLFLM